MRTSTSGLTHVALAMSRWPSDGRPDTAGHVVHYAMPFAVAALIVVLFAGTASAQRVLYEKGRVYPCPQYEPDCALPPASTPLQPWPLDPLQYRKHIPPPPFLGARPPVPYVPPPSIERAPGQ
jgi:hypothetical protein